LPTQRAAPDQCSAYAVAVLTRLRSIISFQMGHSSGRGDSVGDRSGENRPTESPGKAAHLCNSPIYDPGSARRIKFQLVNFATLPRPEKLVSLGSMEQIIFLQSFLNRIL